MKRLVIFLIGTFLINLSTALAQSQEENDRKLYEYHYMTRSSASKSIDGYYSKEDHWRNADLATQYLELAREKNIELKYSIPDKYKTKARPHHDKMEKYYAEAMRQIQNMKTEVSKTNFDEGKVRAYARRINSFMNKAESERMAIQSEYSAYTYY
jgi:hypothetical protein